MKVFKDTTSREWTVEINVTALKRVKDVTGIDLTRLIRPNDDTIERLAEDVVLLFEVLCALVKPQLEQRSVTADAFGEALDEQTAEAAITAVLEGVIDFFRQDKRALLHRALAKVTTAAQKVRQQSIDEAMQTVESEAFDELIERSMRGSSSTSSPASSELTPAP